MDKKNLKLLKSLDQLSEEYGINAGFLVLVRQEGMDSPFVAQKLQLGSDDDIYQIGRHIADEAISEREGISASLVNGILWGFLKNEQGRKLLKRAIAEEEA